MNYNEMSKDQLVSMLDQLDNSDRLGLVYKKHDDDAICQLRDSVPLPREVDELYVDGNGTSNIIIEGDNIHSLTCLKSTNTEVDFIYIDPPYNTGNNDFIYNDKFVQSDDKFKHGKWLSFMEPRLEAARDLLKDTGWIAISIDDNEQAYLKVLCDKVFNEKNFIANCIWQNKAGSNGSGDMKFSTRHEYVLIYAKNKDLVNIGKDTMTPYDIKNHSEDENESWYWRSLEVTLNYLPTMDYEIMSPEGVPHNPLPGRRWQWGKEKVAAEYDRLKFKNGKVYFKQYNAVDGRVPESLLVSKNVKSSGKTVKFNYGLTGAADLKKIFGDKKFDYPKPVKLLEYLIHLTPSDAVVLDFFAGSGTTGEAVLSLNKKNNDSRRFILCTNDEGDIARNITYERIKRVITGYHNQNSKTNEWVDGINSSLRYFKIELHDVTGRLTPEEIIKEHGRGLIKIDRNIFSMCDDSRDGLDIYCEDDNCLAFLDSIYDAESLDLITEYGITDCTVLLVGSKYDDNDDIRMELEEEGYTGFKDIISYPRTYARRITRVINDIFV